MRSWVLALALVGCGDVNKVTDNGPPDAFQADSPPMVSCQASEMLCNGVTCADVMTDELNCGSCNNQCAPTATCHNGTCVPFNATCNQVRALDPAATDGAYFNPQTNQSMYCDFTNSVTYLGFGMGIYTQGYSGYTWMSTVDLNNAQVRKAFIALYNAENGIPALWAPGSTSGNCCLKPSNAAAGQMLYFGATTNYVYPAETATDTINCNGPYNSARFRFFIQQTSEYTAIPLPDNWFDTHVAGVSANCSDTNNPALFMRRKAGLD